jgi:hypothetical protein
MANLIKNTNHKTIITYKFLLILTLMCLLVVPYIQTYYVAKINIILTIFFSLVLFFNTKIINDFKFIERSSELGKPWFDGMIKHRYTLFLSILLILGFIVRVINLTALEPYTDEYVHLLFAREINDDNYERHYLRAYFLTYLVSIIFKIFGESLFNARLPGIIISTLTIIPMYFIGKKIANKHVGIITATLWAFLPWGIMISRNVREYAYFPFFYALIFLLFISFYEYVRKYLRNRTISYHFYETIPPYIILLSLPPIYAFILDTSSTFKQIAIFYIAAFLFISYCLLRDTEINRKIKNIIFFFTLVILTIGVFNFLNHEMSFMRKQPLLNEIWLNGLFFSTSMTAIFFIALTITFITIIFYPNQPNKYPFIGFILFIFLLYLYFYTFHFTRYFRPRYEFALMVWYLPILAFGIYMIIKLINPKKIFTKILLSCLLLVVVINPKLLYVALTHQQHGYVPITIEFHDKVSPVLEKYQTIIKSKTPIVCSLCGALEWYGKVKLTGNNVHYYNYNSPERFKNMQEFMTKHKRGWIFLDLRRNNRWTTGLPTKDTNIGNVNIYFIERLSGLYVYKWHYNANL